MLQDSTLTHGNFSLKRRFMNGRLVLSFLLLSSFGCGRAVPEVAPPSDAIDEPESGLVRFTDATAAAKINFHHFDSATEKHTILETMGSGIGWIDYDADGWPDLFCVQDGPLPPKFDASKTHKLFRNNGDGTFTDVTEKVGLNHHGFGQGCAVGDYDNDGFDDLVVTYFGRTSLFHNVPDSTAPGGRRFQDATSVSKILNPHWGTSCAWGDLDGDGRLDLYICNYCEVDLDRYPPCENADKKAFYICPPTIFPKTAHKLFRNNGDGTFTDASVSSGVAAAPPGGGLAVALVDLDGDGKLEIYVANDLGPAYLLHNQGNGTFKERGMLSGAGLDRNGRFMAGMGIAVGDIDGSGRPSLLVTNYQDEPTEVFLNKGKLTFQEWNLPSGVGPATLKTLGFGIDLLDADLDGNLDLVQTNGHVYKNSRTLLGHQQGQAAQFFMGDGQGRFREVSQQAGAYFRKAWVGRGLAVADWNNDGRPDLAFANNGGPAKLLRNDTETKNHWLRLELIGDGKRSNRNAIGAKVEIECGGRKFTRFVHGGGSYLSASDRRLAVGLGDATKVEVVRVLWPSGAIQEFRDLEVDRGWKLVEGAARPEPDRARKSG